MKLIALIFHLLTAFAQSEAVLVLHDTDVHVIAAQCDRVDPMANICHIAKGEQLTALRVEMPCYKPGARIFFSVVRVGFMRNWSEWVANESPCGYKNWLPVISQR